MVDRQGTVMARLRRPTPPRDHGPDEVLAAALAMVDELTGAAPRPAGVRAVGLANEAALKMREACLAWAESYPVMEYRHGPISITDAHSAVWFLTTPPASLPEEVAATHALVLTPTGDPMAELVRVQRLSVAVAAARGLDPDRPRHLSRSVVLPAQPG